MQYRLFLKTSNILIVAYSTTKVPKSATSTIVYGNIQSVRDQKQYFTNQTMQKPRILIPSMLTTDKIQINTGEGKMLKLILGFQLSYNNCDTTKRVLALFYRRKNLIVHQVNC